jgi:hypothetical protein
VKLRDLSAQGLFVPMKSSRRLGDVEMHIKREGSENQVNLPPQNRGFNIDLSQITTFRAQGVLKVDKVDTGNFVV